MAKLASALQPSDGLPPKADILGVPISLTSYDEAIEIIGRKGHHDRARVIAVCYVHSVMSARRDAALHAAISQADIATTDGVPLVWLLRLTCRPGQTRVYGPDLMKLTLQRGVDRGLRHYLYGTTPATLDRLRLAIERFAPGALIVGQTAPPFRNLTPAETDAVVATLSSSDADIIWVGLGMPKQEKWMHQIAPRLPGKTLVGVGAAFDLLSGTVPQAYPALQRLGLEWAFRLWQEPRRLWRRYVVSNPLYVVLAANQLIRYRMRMAHADLGVVKGPPA
jgi:N-acetylglucosaminyldiphosphoundecaprenol N-acetyl-beta-D-mannosaminyltransferase